MSAAARALDRAATRAPVLRATLAAIALLVAASWGYLLLSFPARTAEFVDPATWSRAVDFLHALLGVESPLAPNPPARPFLDASAWRDMVELAVETLVMSVLAVWIAAAGMLLTVMAGARPRSDEGGTRRARYAAFLAVRATWIVARAVPELVWALLLVLVLPPGPVTGALALGVHNFGIVGRLCAEAVEDLDPRPRRALAASGAGPAQALVYGVLVEALPRFLTYSLYRWEVIIRTSIVVGFVAAGGLGREFRLAMSFFHYTDVAMILVTYLALVLLVDLAAAGLRALAR